MQREKFSSRLGFLLISAGCAVGLGNVWRFPYITGKYGGAAFVLVYLFFLLILGLPIMVMEFAVGRASQKSLAQSFDVLEPKGSKWHWYKYFGIAGNYLLMMFYTTIGGWMIIYFFKMVSGEFSGLSTEEVGNVFNNLMGQPGLMTIAMLFVVAIGFFVCSFGLQKGVEKVNKAMMCSLFIIMIILAVRAVTLEGASEGLKFYLLPNFKNMAEQGIANVVYAAMGQAFFTLSLGIGALAIFGSYISKERSLMGESINVTILDTLVAVIAGLIIFPSCFAFDIDPGEGPKLIYVTLPNVFNNMPGGRIWGALFFIFMTFAALTTIIAVFENIISCFMDLKGWSRKKAIVINGIMIAVLSLPCVLGYNLWSGFQPLGEGSTILDLEDFIVSNNLLPLGSLVYLLFCVSRYGWGFKKFTAEANTGKGIQFPQWARVYVTYILPIIVLAIFILGYLAKFFPEVYNKIFGL
ncbi:MAG: sodium-dependent transporter [Massiliimalia sp.]